MDLIWGYAGILSLGHGLFFALGGYAFGMYLMRADRPRRRVPVGPARLHGLPRLEGAAPGTGTGRSTSAWALALVVLAPGLLALVFGFFAFRSRIRGVYFSIITQALTYAAMLLFFRNDTGFGGNNGFTDFKRILGFPITAPGTRVALFALSVLVLLATLVLCRYLVTSPLRPRAPRHPRRASPRVRFLGYDPLWYKLFIWTLSAVLCAHRRRALRAAGRHHQPLARCRPPTPSRSPSGWRSAAAARWSGAVLGAVLVNLAKSWFTEAFPELWLFFLGFLFVVVTLLPARRRGGPRPQGPAALEAHRRRLRRRPSPRAGRRSAAA